MDFRAPRSLMVASPEVMEAVASTAWIGVLLGALEPDNPPALCAAARCLSLLSRRDKATRQDIMRCGYGV